MLWAEYLPNFSPFSCHGTAYTALVSTMPKLPKYRRLTIMGDKSPKSTNKQAAQKKAKNDGNQQKKNDATAAKQAEKGKK
jgi:hypothetical protein